MDMEDKVIVTIDREFGSGGHEVAKRVAERLGIPVGTVKSRMSNALKELRRIFEDDERP